MSDVLEYLRWRGDLTFERDPLNEADHLVFSVLSYVKMDDLDSEGKTIEEIWKQYTETGVDQSKDTLDPSSVLKQCAESERYRNVRVTRYMNMLSEKDRMQFCAMLFHYLPERIYAAFRGTDSTFTGWHEDLNMSAVEQIPSQLTAAGYVQESLGGGSERLIFGGHSKGGNLAQYAAAACSSDIRERIDQIVSLDGPGFRESFVSVPVFQELVPITVHYVPEESIVGMLMENPVADTVVKCDGALLDQHDPYMWHIMRTSFERAEKLSGISEFTRETVDRWLESLSDEERNSFITMVFNAISSSGASRINEFVSHPFANTATVLSALSKADKETQNQASAVISKLLQASTDTVWETIRAGFIKSEREQDAE